MWNDRCNVTGLDRIIEKGIIVLMLVNIIIALFSLNNEDLLLFEGIIFFLLVTIWLFIILERYIDGYMMDEKGICYRKRFNKKNIKYSDIKAVVISNAVHPKKVYTSLGRWKIIKGKVHFYKYPWFSILNEFPKSKEFPVLLESVHMPRLVDKNSILYGFIWNEERMRIFMERYTGKYYIAASIVDVYQVQLKDICEKYSIKKERICIIEDKTN